METKKIRILLVDDHDAARQGLKALLSLAEDMSVVGEASDGKEGLIRAAELLPDVVIMDGRMAGMNGLEASHVLNKSMLSSKVSMLSNHEQFALEAYNSGIKGYLLKGVRYDTLLDSIRKVYSGESYIDANLGEQYREALACI